MHARQVMIDGSQQAHGGLACSLLRLKRDRVEQELCVFKALADSKEFCDVIRVPTASGQLLCNIDETIRPLIRNRAGIFKPQHVRQCILHCICTPRRRGWG